MTRSGLTADELEEPVRSGNRAALARAVTLIESTRADHRAEANTLLDRLLVADNNEREDALRIGISGTPGVGKSTFIEALGTMLVEAGSKVAVLAVDPSSSRTGGSILGDKTRMERLVRMPNAFIRPSPTSGTLGGVAQRTAEVMTLVEAAGHDVVIVETVGVGQSETAVADMTDLFVLLVAPAGGDDLQGIKRGVMELVDLVVVNKADGDLVNLANHTAADYRHALGLLRPRRGTTPPEVLTCSALQSQGVGEVWNNVLQRWTALSETGELTEIRAGQARLAMDQALERTLLASFLSDSTAIESRASLSDAVAARTRAPSSAAADLAHLLLDDH